jgi:hypothetical protein
MSAGVEYHHQRRPAGCARGAVCVCARALPGSSCPVRPTALVRWLVRWLPALSGCARAERLRACRAVAGFERLCVVDGVDGCPVRTGSSSLAMRCSSSSRRTTSSVCCRMRTRAHSPTCAPASSQTSSSHRWLHASGCTRLPCTPMRRTRGWRGATSPMRTRSCSPTSLRRCSAPSTSTAACSLCALSLPRCAAARMPLARACSLCLRACAVVRCAHVPSCVARMCRRALRAGFGGADGPAGLERADGGHASLLAGALPAA